MLLAAELLDDPGRTISDAALACGYASDSSLRRAFELYARGSGTFFPLSNLPDQVEWVAWLTPLFHGVQLIP